MAARVTLRLLAFSMELVVQVDTLNWKLRPLLTILELSEFVNGNRYELNVFKVDVCGREGGSPAAWLQVNHTGLSTFNNKNGNQASCIPNEGLKTGSRCIAIEKLD